MLELDILRSLRLASGGEAALPFWETVTRLADAGALWVCLSLFLLCFRAFRHAGCVIGTALFTGFLICNVTLKPLVDRLRPCQVQPQDLIFVCPSDPSFPSGHTTASFAAALALSAFHPRWGAAALTLAVAIAWSRMYLFVHWPSDVAAGILIGSFAGAFAVHVLQKTFARRKLPAIPAIGLDGGRTRVF